MHATLHLVVGWVCKNISQSSLQRSLSLSQLPLSTCVTVFAVSHGATQFLLTVFVACIFISFFSFQNSYISILRFVFFVSRIQLVFIFILQQSVCFNGCT